MNRILKMLKWPLQSNSERIPMDEMMRAEAAGDFVYAPPAHAEEEEEEFTDAKEVKTKEDHKTEVRITWPSPSITIIYKVQYLTFALNNNYI